MTTEDNTPGLVLVRQLRGRGDTRHQHARAARRGDEVRVVRGAYVTRDEWEALDRRARHVLRMIAFARTRRRAPVYSHWSAALWHGLPVVGAWPDELHIRAGRTSGGRSVRGVIAHSTSAAAVDVIQASNLRITSIAQTIVDLAAVAPTPAAVAMADHYLRTATPQHDEGFTAARDALRDVWGRALPFRGHRRALDVIAFADGRAGSPLESVSRVNMHAIGCPQPQLQVPFSDRAGLIGYADFFWPALGVLGEADGDLKYLDPSFRGGRSADRVVLDEKIREDRLRALGLRVVRWRWDTATDARALRSTLLAAGLPTDSREPWSVC